MDEWKNSVDGQQGFSDKEKSMMTIASEILRGIRINCNISEQLYPTVNSFLELLMYAFKIPGVTSFLRVVPGSLKRVFRVPMSKGGTNGNPSIQIFNNNTQAFQVISGTCINVQRRNYRTQGSSQKRKENIRKDLKKESAPLPNRKQIFSN